MDTIKFVAPLINNEQQLNDIFLKIKKVLSKKEFNPIKFNVSNIDMYYYIKSHRSNVTEGNTTNIGEFTELVNHRFNNDNEYVVPNKIHDETLEIDNLKLSYDYLLRNSKVSLNVLQNINSILGKDIYKNNFLAHRGSLKKTNNFVPFTFNGYKYEKYFTKPDKVKETLMEFIDNWNNIVEEDEYCIFAKFIILQIQLISIHPFVDGNGRVSRAISENYIENKGYFPYTPYKEEFKRNYQKMMAEFSVKSIEDLTSAYLILVNYFIDEYENNVNEILTSMDKVLESDNFTF